VRIGEAGAGSLSQEKKGKEEGGEATQYA
jgi:hypothetical protein